MAVEDTCSRMAEASATAAAAPQAAAASAEPMTHAEKNIQFKPCRPEDQQRGERWLQKSLKARKRSATRGCKLARLAGLDPLTHRLCPAI